MTIFFSKRIAFLDEITINQIAAGEVVENSASVIKELIENSLDAQATEIFIEIRGEGRGLIRITDNGEGIHPEDLLLSIARNATSKIRLVDDLNQLMSLGFRGEALAAIASVSKIEILTSAEKGGKGFLLKAEGARVEQVVPAARTQGTTVEVNSLFFNVPARRKFQKTPQAEYGEIHKILTQFALCYPEVKFEFTREGRRIFSLEKGEPLKERISHLLGAEYAQGMVPLEQKEGGLILKGFISKPSLHWPNRKGQYAFINGRIISSPYLSQLVLQGYGTRLSSHRYPLYVIHLQLPPAWIDPNVHPQKKEIRLREQQALSSFILKAVEKTLSPSLPPSFALPDLPPYVESSLCEPSLPFTPTHSFTREEELSFLPKKRGEVLAFWNRYVLLRDAEGIRVIDVPSARVRIAAEKRGRVCSQNLLLPLQIECHAQEQAHLLSSLTLLEEEGMVIRHFGGDSFLVEAIPSFMKREEVTDFLRLFLAEEETGEKSKRLFRAYVRAFKKGVSSIDEGELLVETLFATQDPDWTPEGKRIHFLLTEKDFARGFL